MKTRTLKDYQKIAETLGYKTLYRKGEVKENLRIMVNDDKFVEMTEGKNKFNIRCIEQKHINAKNLISMLKGLKNHE